MLDFDLHHTIQRVSGCSKRYIYIFLTFYRINDVSQIKRLFLTKGALNGILQAAVQQQEVQGSGRKNLESYQPYETALGFRTISRTPVIVPFCTLGLNFTLSHVLDCPALVLLRVFVGWASAEEEYVFCRR